MKIEHYQNMLSTTEIFEHNDFAIDQVIILPLRIDSWNIWTFKARIWIKLLKNEWKQRWCIWVTKWLLGLIDDEAHAH